jgi:hypothetical protein
MSFNLVESRGNWPGRREPAIPGVGPRQIAAVVTPDPPIVRIDHSMAPRDDD